MPDHHRVLFPPLSARLVANCLASGAIKPFHLLVVRALIWLPLLTVEELARILSQPARTTAAHLLHLERESLVDHVVCAEGGWPRHYRYYVTDLGLYVFAARHSRPLAPERLAAAYPINRAALLTRLARPVVHLWLCDLVSRLLADGPTQGYQLVSYQQPWELSFSDRTGQRQVKLDAALLVQSPTGSQHAFFVCVDQHERLWTHKQDRNWLRDLCAVRTSLLFEQEPLPALLLLSTPTRYAYWAERLASAFSDASRAPIVGAMTSRQQLAQGPFTRLWTPLQALEPDGPVGAPQTCSFARLCLTPASPGLVEQLSNTFSFAHLFAQAGEEGSARQTHRFPRFVGVSLQAEVAL